MRTTMLTIRDFPNVLMLDGSTESTVVLEVRFREYVTTHGQTIHCIDLYGEFEQHVACLLFAEPPPVLVIRESEL